MPRLTPGDVHSTTYLGNIALMWMQDQSDYICNQIAPVVRVAKESDKYAIFTQADFARIEANVIANGDPAERAGFGVSSATYTCEEYGLGYQITERDRQNQDSPFQLQVNGTLFAADQVMKKREYDCATAIFNTTNYSNYSAVSVAWDSADAKAFEDVLTGFDNVEDQASGWAANTIVMGIEGWRQFRLNPNVLQYVFGPGADRAIIPTRAQVEAAISDYVGKPVRLFVGRGVYNTSAEAATASYSKIWGKYCWIAYVAPNPARNLPSAAYTFEANYEVRKWYETATKNDIIEVREIRDIKATSAACAYLWTSVVN